VASTDSMLLVVATIAVLVSVGGAMFSYYSLSTYQSWVTGFVTGVNATVNITINSNEAINFTTSNISFGSGRVNDGVTIAVLESQLSGTSVNGTWTQPSSGLRLENVGNVNVTLNIKTMKNATTFIGGTTGGGPAYQLNFSHIEASSCVNTTMFNEWQDVNMTGNGTLVCSNFKFVDASDTMRIDIRLKIPADSTTGALSDYIVAWTAPA
jgi:hypothetical protein